VLLLLVTHIKEKKSKATQNTGYKTFDNTTQQQRNLQHGGAGYLRRHANNSGMALYGRTP